MTRLLRWAAVLACVVLASCGARHSRPPSGAVSGQSLPSTTSVTGGHSSDRAGSIDEAVSAVVRFVCSGQRLLDTPPTQLADAIRDLWSARAADDAVTRTVAQLAELRDRLTSGRGPTRYRQSVLAVRVESASAAKVVVSVWWVGVLSRDGAATPQAQWFTSTVTVVREADAWRVDAASNEQGPVPDHSVDGEPITNDEFERRLTGFVDWGAPR